MGVIIGMDPHKRSATIEVIDERGAGARRRPVRHRQGRLRRDARRRPPVTRIGSGRSRAATASAGTSRSGWCTTARPCWTCRRSCPRRCGCSPPATAARPTRSTRTRSRWSRCAPRTWCGSRSMTTWWCWAAGRPPRRARPGPHPDHQPAAPAAAGAVPRRGEAVPVRAPGPRAARHRPAARHRRQDPPPARGRADRRARGHRQEDQGREQGADRAGRAPAAPP